MNNLVDYEYYPSKWLEFNTNSRVVKGNNNLHSGKRKNTKLLNKEIHLSQSFSNYLVSGPFHTQFIEDLKELLLCGGVPIATHHIQN